MPHRLTVIVAVLGVAACTSSEAPEPDASLQFFPPVEIGTTLVSDVGAELDVIVEDAASRRATPIADAYRETVNRILHEALTNGQAHERLRHLCDVIGPRLSGSQGLANAVAWTSGTMRDDGVDRVELMPVMVPAWVRGNEDATMVVPRRVPLKMLGLGNSIGTPSGGIEADVVVVRDFDELKALGDAVAGKIVLYDHPMPTYDPVAGSGYGQTVRYRTSGASNAAAQGAVAVLVRSVTATSLQTPHTGMLRYDTAKPRIPAAAVSTEDAEMLHRLLDAGQTVRVRLNMEAHFEDDAPSANVIGDIIGSELPDEIVLISGHLDSWDVGHGAHDDGANCMAVMDALRLLKSMGLRPRRTIRAVLWTNEENGLRGSREYINAKGKEIPMYAAAIEADSGAYRPLGYTRAAAKDERGERINARLADLMTLFDTIGAGRLRDGGGGADIGAMAAFGVPMLGLDVEGSRYFDIHHTHADTFDKVDRDDLLHVEAVLAATAFVLADMPDRLGD